MAVAVFCVLLTAAQPTGQLADIQRALAGSWVGTLEYRDFSDPAPSTKRVKLPTWLTIEPAGADLRFRYIYDDGPSKTVTELETVRIDPTAARYQIIGDDTKVKDTYAIAGLPSLREGRGTLTLTGAGTENDALVDVRTTVRIGRNILEITREAAPPSQPPVCRHAYILVRASPPGK